jgi:hypothetical protein
MYAVGDFGSASRISDGDPDEGILVAFVFLVGLVLLVAWGLWAACHPQPVFVIRVEDGVARLVRGKVTQAFLQQIDETCDRHQVRHAVVRGVANGSRIALAFSGDIPAPCRQQLRNIWNLSGWSVRPRQHP